MIPLAKRVWFLLWYDEQAALRWMRAFLAGCGAMFISLAAYVPGEWPAVMRIVGTVLISVTGMITAGQRNPSPEQLAVLVAEGKAKEAP